MGREREAEQREMREGETTSDGGGDPVQEGRGCVYGSGSEGGEGVCVCV